MKEIVEFIYTEVALVKDSYQKGVYSKEFALGRLSSLYNLAAKHKLSNQMEDIHDMVHHLCYPHVPGESDKRSSCVDESSNFHLDPKFASALDRLKIH
jgi:hypothetical protein